MTNMWATVITVDSTNGTITVKFDNGDTSNKPYRYPKAGYTPQVGDRAYFQGNVCLGIY